MICRGVLNAACCNFDGLGQLNHSPFSADYVREGRWKGRTSFLGQKVLEHWPLIICSRSAVASKSWPALSIQGHPWTILTSGTPSICSYPLSIILICPTCWIRFKNRGRPRNQLVLHGYYIWEATQFKVIDYRIRS